MLFYGFNKKNIRSEIRDKCREIMSDDLESVFHKKILKLSGDASKNYVFALQQFVVGGETDIEIETLIKNGEFCWNHPSLRDEILTINEMRDYIQKPLEVDEGIIKCEKCGSRRVFSYQKQTRGCDESSTTFAQCAKCEQKWTYSG
jgi:DNA-directed RNA polymerase subunit M/transcription elongation factor TFIIS